MNNYPLYLKQKLFSKVSEMSSCKDQFVLRPGKDFTRDRKLNFESTLKVMLSMGGSTLSKELLDLFGFDLDRVSVSAFVQQRKKLLPYAFKHLFYNFLQECSFEKCYKGYRLIAFDGSSLSIPYDKSKTDTHYETDYHPKGFNYMHMNAMYDVCNKVYLEARLQLDKTKGECSFLDDMVDQSDIKEPVIVLADRGYESFKSLAHITEKGWKYAIRIKDSGSTGILSAVDLPDEEEYEMVVTYDLTHKKAQAVIDELPNYKFLPSSSKFDLIETPDRYYYTLSFRIARFKLSEDSYEIIVTNLDSKEFPSSELKLLYFKRWGIETSFRELKYSVGLTNFHAKSAAGILQEVFCRLIMYNFSSMITLHVIIKKRGNTYGYKANFDVAVHICKYLISPKGDAKPPDVEALIRQHVHPIRPGRTSPRSVRPRRAVGFNYRVS